MENYYNYFPPGRLTMLVHNNNKYRFHYLAYLNLLNKFSPHLKHGYIPRKYWSL